MFNDPKVREIVFMTSGQIGKTTITENIMGYCMDLAPAPMLTVLPNIGMADAFSKDRLDPMIRDTPVLKRKVKSPKSRDSGNTLKHKKFPGGQVTLIGGNAPADMSMRPIKYAFIEERDRLAEAAGKEGDPYFLIIQRQENYYGAKMVQNATPTFTGSPIAMAYDESDQRHYHIPCRKCGSMQQLIWANVRWEKKVPEVPEDVWYECAHCEEHLSDGDLVIGLKRGVWIADEPFRGVAGFHINAIYSPWVPMQRMVSKFLRAKKDSESLRAWVNTQLGETFEEGGDGIEPGNLFARREHYKAEVPTGAVCLTASVDVQDDRLECEVYGWGIGEERWSITYRVLWGDPSENEVWEALDDVLLRGKFKHESGAVMGIASTCIDSGGHHTKRVYEYCRARNGKRIFPIVGKGGFGKAMVSQPSRKRHGRNRRPVDLFTLGVDEIKTHIHSKLGVVEEGPGYCHFPISDEYGTEYFEQLGAEVVRTKFVKGVPRRHWVQTRPRNEALDNNVYGYAAFILLNPNIEALAGKLVKKKPEDEPSGKGRKSKKPAKRGGFVNRWK